MAYRFKPNWLLRREAKQFEAEVDRYAEEVNRLDQEVEELQRQLQETTDESTKKQLQQEISITQAKMEVADAKLEKAGALLFQRYHEQREEKQFEAEVERHKRERDRLKQELEELRHQFQEITDESTKKQLQQEISITKVKMDVADEKLKRTEDFLSVRRVWEEDFEKENMKKIEEYKEEAKEHGDKVKENEEHLKKLESEKKRDQHEEKQSKKKSQRLLDEALKEGFMEVIIVVCIVLGQPGVGKTHLKYLLLDRRPPHLRTSTICAETPVRVEIRTVSGTKVQNIQGQWKEVNDEDMLDIVAKMILLAEPQLHQKSEQSVFAKVANLFSSQDQGAAGAKLPSSKQYRKRREHKQKDAEPTISDSCKKAMELMLDKIMQRISKLKCDGFSSESEGEAHSQEGSSEQSIGEIILKSKWVYFTDSGGQPQYHELLPLFVRSISSALCVTRLTDRLDETQEVVLYQDGKQVGATQQSQLSTKDTIQCLVSTIQSYSTQDKPPKIIMIGTHLDKLEEMSTKETSTCQSEPKMQPRATIESVEEKDKKLIDMLKPEFGNQLVYPSNDMKKLLFSLNTLKPGKREEGIAQSLRHAIEASGAREEKIPIWWYIMELLLQELARELGRGVLSRAECLEMARLLYIHEDSFDAALEFFDVLNVVKYSPDVLPNVVFVDSQIPLDKVSELVSHSFLLRQPESGESSLPLEGEWSHFRDSGIVSKACLKSKDFSRHYVPGIFSADDLCELLKRLLVFAPVPNPALAHKDGQSSSMSDKEEAHFVMPAALESLLEVALAQYRESSPEITPLLIRFPKGSRRAGVFCCFVVHLIKHFGWGRILDDAQPLYRNCFKLHLPTDPPCSVTLIDSNSLIEVHVKLAAGAVPSKCSPLLNVIKNALLSGIDAACIALNYKQTKPEFTFHCPHTQPSSQTSHADRPEPELKPHTATLNDKKTFLICDLARSNSYPLQAGHRVWFGLTKAASTSDEDASSDIAQGTPVISSPLSAVDQQPVSAASATQASASHLPHIVEYVSISSTVTEGLPDTSVSTSSKPCGDVDEHSIACTDASSPEKRITLQDIATRAGIDKLDIFDQVCSQKMFLNLSKHCVHWKLIGHHLELTEADITAVDEDNQTAAEKRAGMLRQWKRKFAFKATYRVFVEALLACGRTEDAVDACGSIAKDIVATSSCRIEQLPTAFKLVVSLSNEWENIGLCLGLNNFEESIKTSAGTAPSCLRETLKLWLNRVDPPPTWKELAEAVEPFNSDIAAKIKTL